jgi:flagellar biosynthesis chaperone FliJ
MRMAKPTVGDAVSKINSERELVTSNIKQLEENINAMTQQLNQAQQNLIASRGAVMAFERLLSVLTSPAPKGAQPDLVDVSN